MGKLGSYIARLREYVGDRRVAPRYVTHLEKSLVVYVSRADLKAGANDARRPPMIVGYTRDVSETGLGIVVQQIRTGGLNITAPERPLRLLLGVPVEPIEMQVVPVRYLQLEAKEDEIDRGYLVGMHIEEMSAEMRRRYLKIIGTLQSEID